MICSHMEQKVNRRRQSLFITSLSQSTEGSSTLSFSPRTIEPLRYTIAYRGRVHREGFDKVLEV